MISYEPHFFIFLNFSHVFSNVCELFFQQSYFFVFLSGSTCSSFVNFIVFFFL